MYFIKDSGVSFSFYGSKNLVFYVAIFSGNVAALMKNQEDFFLVTKGSQKCI